MPSKMGCTPILGLPYPILSRLPKEKMESPGIFTKKARLPQSATAAAIPKESRNKDSVYE